MAFGIPGITAPPQPVPVNPIDPLNPKTQAGSGPSPNASPPMTPDRVQRSSDAATNQNAYHDAIVRVYGASGTAAISAPDHATKTDPALTHGAASQSVKAASAAQKIVPPSFHPGQERDVRASEHAPITAEAAVAKSDTNASSGSNWLGAAGSFVKGVSEGAWDGGSGMVQGVGDLAKGGYKLATSAYVRSQAVDAISKGATAAGDFAKTTITDPAKAAGQVGHAASRALNSVSTAYQQAQASGNGAEFIGKAVGQGAVLAATLPVPGGAEAESAAALGDAGRMAKAAGDLGKAGEDGTAAGKALHVTDSASSNAATHFENLTSEFGVARTGSAVTKHATGDALESAATREGADATSKVAETQRAASAIKTSNVGDEQVAASNDVSISSPSRKPIGSSHTELTTTHSQNATQSSKLARSDSKEVDHRVSPDRRKHILDGDGTGGGHRAGTGKAGKSEFPSTWSDDEIITNLESVANDTSSTQAAGRNGRTIIRGQRDGIDIEVVVGTNNEIVTGYPTNLSRNPRL